MPWLQSFFFGGCPPEFPFFFFSFLGVLEVTETAEHNIRCLKGKTLYVCMYIRYFLDGRDFDFYTIVLSVTTRPTYLVAASGGGGPLSPNLWSKKRIDKSRLQLGGGKLWPQPPRPSCFHHFIMRVWMWIPNHRRKMTTPQSTRSLQLHLPFVRAIPITQIPGKRNNWWREIRLRADQAVLVVPFARRMIGEICTIVPATFKTKKRMWRSYLFTHLQCHREGNRG